MNYIRTLHRYSHAIAFRADLLYELNRAKRTSAWICDHHHRLCWDILRRPAREECFIRLLRFLSPEDSCLLFDIGANTGYWLEHFLRYFPQTEAVGFEPTRNACERLKKRFWKRKNVIIHNVGLSETKGKVEIHIANDSRFSSLYEYKDPQSFSGSETIVLNSFDENVGDELLTRPVTKIVKIDVQGHEMSVLRGMDKGLGKIDIIILETSFLTDYKGLEPSFPKISAALNHHGFYPVMFFDYGRVKSPYAIERDVVYIKEQHFQRVMHW